MQKEIKMVVFDMAGTTIDEDNLVYKTLTNAINNAGFNLSLEQVLAVGAGSEKKQAIKSVLEIYAGVTDTQLIDSIFEKFMVQLAEAYATAPIYPQPNAAQLMTALRKRGIITVLNTGYDRTTAQSILEKIEWEEGLEFDALVTASDVPSNRPNPDMILLAMNKFNISDAQTVVKVGDSIIDIQEGQNAGCGFNIGILTGAHTTEQLQTANPDAIIANLMDLLPLLDQKETLPQE